MGDAVLADRNSQNEQRRTLCLPARRAPADGRRTPHQSTGRAVAVELATRRVCQDLRPRAKPGRLRWCDVLRILTIGTKVGHYGLRSDDLSTNKLSAGALAANGCASVTPADGASRAIGSSLGLSFVAPSGGFGLGGNSALDQPRSRSSDAESVPGEGSFGGGVVSEPMSRNSMLVSFGMSKFGASPFAAVAITASANRTSGRSHEP